ncbi:S-adenosyl-L-methionine-dependent methyltransferase [Xylariaceae sp. FL0255]|nr:S-adenosyl-L-methionine-dependent methyltransferase [Xylariaceae sp. FL0255]
MATSYIIELATRIETDTSKVGEYLIANDLPQPLFDINAPLHGAVPATAPEMLRDPMLGPRDYLFNNFSHTTLLTPQAATRLNLARNLPVGGQQTFAEMASKAGLPEASVKRLPGVVAYSAVSRLLVEDAGHEAAQTCNAMAQFPSSDEPNETGFVVANNTSLPIHEFLANHPARSARFSNMLKAFTTGQAFDLKFVSDFYPCSQHDGGTVVDVGGSQGHVCAYVARKFPTLKFIVQDLKPVRTEAQRQAPADVIDRVSFMRHDFFKSQAHISLIPAMKPGAKVIISEAIVREPGKMPKSIESRVRSFDLVMTSIQNAKERDFSEWIELFHREDPGFSFERAISPPGSQLSLLVATWKGNLRIHWSL